MARFEDGRVTTVEFHREFEAKTGGRLDWPTLDHAISEIFTPNYELWPVVTALSKTRVIVWGSCRTRVPATGTMSRSAIARS
jgi:hypothetical protein